jgi:hypothetical protein
MDWADVCSVAVQMKPPEGSKKYAKDWVNPQKAEVK